MAVSCGGDRMTNKYEQRLLEAFSFASTKSLSSSMKFLGLLVQCCQAYSLNSLEQTALMTVKSVMEVHLRRGERKECSSSWSKFTHTGLEMCSHKFCKRATGGPSHLLTFADCLRPLQAAFHWTTHILNFLTAKKVQRRTSQSWDSSASEVVVRLQWWAAIAVTGGHGDMAAQRKSHSHGVCCKLEEFRNGSQLIWHLGSPQSPATSNVWRAHTLRYCQRSQALLGDAPLCRWDVGLTKETCSSFGAYNKQRQPFGWNSFQALLDRWPCINSTTLRRLERSQSKLVQAHNTSNQAFSLHQLS